MNTGSGSSSGQSAGTFPGWSSGTMMPGPGSPTFGFNSSGGSPMFMGFPGTPNNPMMTGGGTDLGALVGGVLPSNLTPQGPQYGNYGGPAPGIYPSGGGDPNAQIPGHYGGAGINPAAAMGAPRGTSLAGAGGGGTAAMPGGGSVQWGPAAGTVMQGLMPLIQRLVGAMG